VKRILILLVNGYSRFISPAVPPLCRFEPTCSAYAREALQTHGALRGTALTVWRLLRCNPFGGKGYDPAPDARDVPHQEGPQEEGPVQDAGKQNGTNGANDPDPA